MTLDDFPGHDERVIPPAGMTGEPGPLLRLIRDQRIAFLLVGVTNTVVGTMWFIVFQALLERQLGYIVVLLCAHVAAVLCAFVLYRTFVFRVKGHLLRDLARFEVVNLSALGVNLVALPVLVEVFSLPVLLSQLIITGATMLISFFGHRGFSFRRSAAELDRTATSATPASPATPGTPADERPAR
jgi:putative flippase GtrA